MLVLVVNAGSSSLKLSLVDGENALDSYELPATHEVDPQQLNALLKRKFAGADVVGHRIVHGGGRFRSSVLIDAVVRNELEQLKELAPLHQPKSLMALDAVSEALPGLPAVACFDTAFHATLSQAAATYALPAPWRDKWPIRRYGFHGLSHAWVARRAPELLQRESAELRIVSCHLGAGASVCAIGAGRSVDTTMGFTPLEGLVMATRSGSVDPGLLLWLLQRAGLGTEELEHALEHESGLLGLGGSADMRLLLEQKADGREQARLALEVYVHRLRGAIASMVAALGSIDVLVFTGGVGERSPEIRGAAAQRLGFLGLAVDEDRNARAIPDAEITHRNAHVRTLVLRAREDLEIAAQVRRLVGGS